MKWVAALLRFLANCKRKVVCKRTLWAKQQAIKTPAGIAAVKKIEKWLKPRYSRQTVSHLEVLVTNTNVRHLAKEIDFQLIRPSRFDELANIYDRAGYGLVENLGQTSLDGTSLHRLVYRHLLTGVMF